ncbi:SUMO activating enzyme [Trichosporon asahii var. asahii CBS 2479]|uniref:SUMO activating enzyme n=1 Tax=Trichosporon asahii var. asahii (strain ATCC 90039 / CBS 2479 / JCM 2466 / KCTC 7840 / NBRC 103889/ NCYC 2677 / UAMH 7654) TaxID=1186058 RepID=J8TY05_TRIAS|nr:SUMO activating enzyme [Trichosporon asahii var. asahii CBS 2479]EJT52977.1 SUMO activating enzyme [Trichosporon asahii var. asahii CBS 2479]
MSDEVNNAAPATNGQITEVLILSLRSVAHETIKNLVLAGIGRLIVMDDGAVTEEDLGSGFLFREEDGAVGKNVSSSNGDYQLTDQRTEAALAQIQSLNPLVSLTAEPTLAPFVGSDGAPGDRAQMAEYLKREGVDVVVACDFARPQLEAINAAVRDADSMFFAAGSYGFYGYIFADLGAKYENVASALIKLQTNYVPLSQALDRSKWQDVETPAGKGGSPFRGLSKANTRQARPDLHIALQSLWDYEAKHGLPSSSAAAVEIQATAEQMLKDLGVNKRTMRSVDEVIITHLAEHATHFFPPTLAILGGLLAQDVLRALSRKDNPITNLLVLDSMGGAASVARWGMDEAVIKKN